MSIVWEYQDNVRPSMFEDSDNMPSDPEQADWYEREE